MVSMADIRGTDGMAALDHAFMFVASEAEADRLFARDGLRVNYRRQHPGQGTRNACAALDDVFLELLWLDGTRPSDATSAIGLPARGRGEGSPFGISWRGEADLPTVPYAAPFLPDGITIPVARASVDDPSLPFVFRTPGGAPPADRPELTGERQTPDLSTLHAITLYDPEPARLGWIAGAIDGLVVEAGAPGMTFTLADPSGRPARTVEWRP